MVVGESTTTEEPSFYGNSSLKYDMSVGIPLDSDEVVSTNSSFRAQHTVQVDSETRVLMPTKSSVDAI
ncbi:hypothetical protein V6N12_030825 [Hibiscus sabdariffa]|uniref:Uncharacterized protein n=1 Tax=Hibiscus sabdariffa TaxID=183260 RepID=A0ABR2E782_9ROSI